MDGLNLGNQPSARLGMSGRNLVTATIAVAVSFSRVVGKQQMGPVNLEDLVARLDRLDKENQSLRAGKERLELAQQETGIGFYDWDLINGSADLSEEWLKIYGRPADMAQITF